MKYEITEGGPYLKPEMVKNGDKITIVAETTTKESRFTNEDGSPKTDNLTKVRLEGHEETLNARLNWTTVKGLVDAFGTESKDWCNKPLTVEIKEYPTGDAIMLLPEGYEVTRDKDKRHVIKKKSSDDTKDPSPDDIPF